MITELPTAWEDVESPHVGDYLERIKVPGGWLYRCMIHTPRKPDEDEHNMLAMTFVPEP